MSILTRINTRYTNPDKSIIIVIETDHQDIVFDTVHLLADKVPFRTNLSSSFQNGSHLDYLNFSTMCTNQLSLAHVDPIDAITSPLYKSLQNGSLSFLNECGITISHDPLPDQFQCSNDETHSNPVASTSSSSHIVQSDSQSSQFSPTVTRTSSQTIIAQLLGGYPATYIQQKHPLNDHTPSSQPDSPSSSGQLPAHPKSFFPNPYKYLRHLVFSTDQDVVDMVNVQKSPQQTNTTSDQPLCHGNLLTPHLTTLLHAIMLNATRDNGNGSDNDDSKPQPTTHDEDHHVDHQDSSSSNLDGLDGLFKLFSLQLIHHMFSALSFRMKQPSGVQGNPPPEDEKDPHTHTFYPALPSNLSPRGVRGGITSQDDAPDQESSPSHQQYPRFLPSNFKSADEIPKMNNTEYYLPNLLVYHFNLKSDALALLLPDALQAHSDVIREVIHTIVDYISTVLRVFYDETALRDALYALEVEMDIMKQKAELKQQQSQEQQQQQNPGNAADGGQQQHTIASVTDQHTNSSPFDFNSGALSTWRNAEPLLSPSSLPQLRRIQSWNAEACANGSYLHFSYDDASLFPQFSPFDQQSIIEQLLWYRSKCQQEKPQQQQQQQQLVGPSTRLSIDHLFTTPGYYDILTSFYTYNRIEPTQPEPEASEDALLALLQNYIQSMITSVSESQLFRNNSVYVSILHSILVPQLQSASAPTPPAAATSTTAATLVPPAAVVLAPIYKINTITDTLSSKLAQRIDNLVLPAASPSPERDDDDDEAHPSRHLPSGNELDIPHDEDSETASGYQTITLPKQSCDYIHGVKVIDRKSLVHTAKPTLIAHGAPSTYTNHLPNTNNNSHPGTQPPLQQSQNNIAILLTSSFHPNSVRPSLQYSQQHRQRDDTVRQYIAYQQQQQNKLHQLVLLENATPPSPANAFRHLRSPSTGSGPTPSIDHGGEHMTTPRHLMEIVPPGTPETSHGLRTSSTLSTSVSVSGEHSLPTSLAFPATPTPQDHHESGSRHGSTNTGQQSGALTPMSSSTHSTQPVLPPINLTSEIDDSLLSHFFLNKRALPNDTITHAYYYQTSFYYKLLETVETIYDDQHIVLSDGPMHLHQLLSHISYKIGNCSKYGA